jgi:hypothetical protein
MSDIIPFDFSSPIATVARRAGSINRDVIGTHAATFPVLSIKGKVFTLVKGAEKKVLTREIDGEEEPIQTLQITVARANTKYRVFYATQFTEGESDGKKPTCFSMDGVTPDLTVAAPQSKKCQGCSQNVWGVRDGKGFACNTKTRLAIVDPVNMGEPFLLNVPAASRASFAKAVEAAEERGVDYNELVMKLSFDKDAASPKLVFKPVGKLTDATYAKVKALYDNELVMEMVGARGAAPAETAVDTDELDAALAADKAVKSAKAIPAPKPAPKVTADDLDDIDDVVAKPAKVEPKAEVKKPAAPKKAKVADADDDLLGDLDSLLGSTDD